MTVNLDWDNLGFAYRKLPFRYISHFKDGKWDDGKLTDDATLHISESSPALHYGQQAFEGLKAYRTKDGSIQLFRPDQNAERLQRTADRLLMPHVPTDKFIAAVKSVVRANEEFVPPYGTGATLYIRPLLIGVGDIIGVKPAEEYIFTVFAMPVGSYFKGGLTPTNFIVSKEYDRAAPNGTGAAKVGGNYAASLLPGKYAHEKQFSDVIYLDPATHTKIEEVGAANFFGITKDNQFITPLSPSILPSITKYSLLYLAKERFSMEAIEGDVFVDELDKFTEAGACGTAAVISPIGGIQNGDDFHVFYSETEVGPVTRKLYDELVGIQFGDVEAPEGWIYKVD
ncbi:branched-chain amino acid aminotransferase [Streptococcus agalactiae]|uniref:Branched-chain-amino-acid aminotransferase n=1 Tax=Streptococcus agalactiae MRI Z1-216 TaxID=1154879 RepID=A0AAD3A3G1_STRAG|nr:branched-chain amino acid aminotransferase [Streptococcus agalactiae]EPU37717.1 branched-chain amino acid aminotransferase [Streptococcus agalactiae MRI Z1-213]EPU39246.1 branched-chain amino acid aminotransferase [Streptococcus agalactiae MRI Z1-216]EPU40412.1 branched-chain amino acid aminotransferase [Streptococcus agalactiae MRI Z1-214]EPX10945.1 branched-chain amino acid aminotransferase [Streptococcus agalactiae MRI Z1-217]MCC9673141.1 branched-chain amino acid aminotransferase [Strep